MLSVALWGAYRQKNFGDDLMAVVFAREIQKAGHCAKILDLDEHESQTYELPLMSTKSQVFNEARGIVLGGGAVLKEAQYIRAVLNPTARKIELSYMHLRRSMHQAKLPLFPVSIGSDGLTSISAASIFRRAVLSSQYCTSATVRLPSDVALMADLGVKASYFPDVLLATAELFPRPKRTKRATPERIFINLHKSKSSFGKNLIEIIQEKFPFAEIFVGNSHLATSGIDYEWDASEIEGISYYQYTGTSDFLNFLSTIDLVISSKLHLGICAASYGAVFISVDGRGKVLAQLDQLGLGDAFVSSENHTREKIVHVLEKYEGHQERYAIKVATLSQDSLGHLHLLRQWMSIL